MQEQTDNASNWREKRISTRLTVQEIKMHWNRTPIMQCIEEQLRQAMVIIYIGTQTQQGVSEFETYDQYRKPNPIYGEPEMFVQPILPGNGGCGVKLGLLGGSSCTHTKTAFEQLSSI